MPKLHEIIAVVDGKKTHTTRKFTDLHRITQKPEFFIGHERIYEARNSDDDAAPPEGTGSRIVQERISKSIEEAHKLLTELWKAVSTQDEGNTLARADVVLEDGTTVAENVPVTHLLFLEKQLDNIDAFINGLVTLDPASIWDYDANSDLFRTAPIKTARNIKQLYPVVLYDATDKHPAQVKEASKDIHVGTYLQTNFSGAIRAQTKRLMLERVREVKDAVKRARAKANEQEISQQNFGANILKFVFDIKQ